MLSLSWCVTNCHDDIAPETLWPSLAYPESRQIAIEGLPVHIREKGQGPLLLLLHDENSSLHTWQTWFDTLSQDYRVIAVDLPGFGLTGPHPRGSYSVFMYASFLEQLADTLSVKKCSMAGVGLGAQIAWFYASEHPEKVEKLILMAAPGYEKSASTWFSQLARTPVINRLMWNITPHNLVELWLREIYADDQAVNDSLVNRHFNLLLRTGNRKAFTDRAAVIDNNPPVDMVKRIKCPTLILWGAEDAVLSPQKAYDFHRNIPGSLLSIYKNTGHWPQEENAAQSARDAGAFLKGKF